MNVQKDLFKMKLKNQSIEIQFEKRQKQLWVELFLFTFFDCVDYFLYQIVTFIFFDPFYSD